MSRFAGRVILFAAALLLTIPWIARADEHEASEPAWRVVPERSVVGFEISNLGFTTVEGRFHEFEATVRYDPGNLTDAAVEATIRAASIDTENEERDEHLRTEDFFHVERYPTLEFRSRNVGEVGVDGLELIGDLTIHGVTKEVVLYVRGPRPLDGERGYRASAETTIDRRDFGIEYSGPLGLGNAAIGKEVRIEIEAVLLPAGGPGA